MSETASEFRIGSGPSDLPSDPNDLFDPVTPAEAAASTVSPLEALRGALEADVVSEPITLRVPGRPGVSIRCHTHMTQEQRKAWQARARKKKRGRAGEAPEVDEMHFAQLVIANTCESVLFGGVEATDSEGTPLTFAHRQLWDMLHVGDPASAIRKFFGVDAHVLLASGEVLLASGFDDDLTDEGEGPTQG